MPRTALEISDSLIVPPAQLPISVSYARLHLNSLGHDDDVLIASWIGAATSYIEGYTGRQLITAQREQATSAFAVDGRIELSRAPLQTVDSIQYYDGAAWQTLANTASPADVFEVYAPQGPFARRGYVRPLIGAVWPTVTTDLGAVRVRYTCGYGDTPADVPDLLKAAICWLVAHFDQNRSAVMELGRGSASQVPLGLHVMLDDFKLPLPRSTFAGVWE